MASGYATVFSYGGSGEVMDTSGFAGGSLPSRCASNEQLSDEVADAEEAWRSTSFREIGLEEAMWRITTAGGHELRWQQSSELGALMHANLVVNSFGVALTLLHTERTGEPFSDSG